jgi:hypothetical protein
LGYERPIVTFGVPENDIVLPGHFPSRDPPSAVTPDDLISKLVLPENLVHDDLGIVADVPIKMKKERSLGRQ